MQLTSQWSGRLRAAHFGAAHRRVSNHMHTISEAKFLEATAELGIVLDDRFPHSRSLIFSQNPDVDRFWLVPREPERRPAFIDSILELMGDWSSCYAWRHKGEWPAGCDPLRTNDVIEFEILSGLGMPRGTTDAVEFNRSEVSKLIVLVFSTTIFGWSVHEDLHIVPNHGRFFAQTDHHNVIHVSFRNASDCLQFVNDMEIYGFPLPTELPDATFGRPKWMPGV